jgi:hypothetical protein
MRNVGVRAARGQEPQQWVAHMGIFMLVPLGPRLSLVMWSSLEVSFVGI